MGWVQVTPGVILLLWGLNDLWARPIYPGNPKAQAEESCGPNSTG